MKKKIIAMLLASAMLCMSFVGCGGSKQDDVSSAAEVKATVDVSNVKLIKDGTLTVGMEIGYPPFEDKAENGDPVGYDVDLVYAVADKLGLEVNIVDTAFDVIFAGIGTNYDCVVSAVTITDERRENCLFSDPYIDSYQAVVVKKGSDIKIESLKDLSGKSVALQDATTSKALLDDMIKTGNTMLTTASILKEKGARDIYYIAPFGMFTNGFDEFDKAYKDGLIKAVVCTNLIYRPKELLEKEWYVDVNMTPYVARIIDALNVDESVSKLINSTSRIREFLDQIRFDEFIEDVIY